MSRVISLTYDKIVLRLDCGNRKQVASSSPLLWKRTSRRLISRTSPNWSRDNRTWFVLQEFISQIFVFTDICTKRSFRHCAADEFEICIDLFKCSKLCWDHLIGVWFREYIKQMHRMADVEHSLRNLIDCGSVVTWNNTIGTWMQIEDANDKIQRKRWSRSGVEAAKVVSKMSFDPHSFVKPFQIFLFPEDQTCPTVSGVINKLAFPAQNGLRCYRTVKTNREAPRPFVPLRLVYPPPPRGLGCGRISLLLFLDSMSTLRILTVSLSLHCCTE